MFRGERPRETKLAPEWTLERMARHAIDFWLSTEDLPRPDNRVTVDGDGKLTLTYTETNVEAKKRLYAKVKSMLGKLDMNPDHLIHRFAYMKNDIPIARLRAPGGHRPVRHRPGDVGARRELQGARARQPVRRRHERLPEHRRGQPGAHGDGELAPRRRPPARAAEVAPGREGGSMATQTERTVVYAAGVVQGIALVTFPAASTILTDPVRVRPLEHAVRRALPAPGDHRDHGGVARRRPGRPVRARSASTSSASPPASRRWRSCS